MTKRQKQLLQFIKKYMRSHGYAPNYLEMMEEMNLKSKSVVHYYLKQLQDLGKIKIHTGRSRGIEISTSQKKKIEALEKQLYYAERGLRAIMVTTSDAWTIQYARDVLLAIAKERECQ